MVIYETTQKQKSKHVQKSSQNSLSHGQKVKINTIPVVKSSKQRDQNLELKPGLYIIATPIGNASDITLRALETLKLVDIIVCEDTRVTSKLLSIHGISKPLMIYHEHNANRAGPKVIERLIRGEIVALVSDAGTPLISDPGFNLIQSCINKNIHITHLPGACSIINALILAGLPTDKFLFVGFPPNKTGKRKTLISNYKFIQASLVFLENPKRLTKTLKDLYEILGDRSASIGRELTKKYEEVHRGQLKELSNIYNQKKLPKGEITIVISPPATSKKTPSKEIEQLIKTTLECLSFRETVNAVVEATGESKKNIYKIALKFINKKN